MAYLAEAGTYSQAVDYFAIHLDFSSNQDDRTWMLERPVQQVWPFGLSKLWRLRSLHLGFSSPCRSPDVPLLTVRLGRISSLPSRDREPASASDVASMVPSGARLGLVGVSSC